MLIKSILKKEDFSPDLGQGGQKRDNGVAPARGTEIFTERQRQGKQYQIV